MRSRKVEVVAYNPLWPTIYHDEAERIKKALGSHLTAIYHIGSTSIPNMPAKPVIDLLLACHDLDETVELDNALTQLGYTKLRRSIVPHCSFFTFREENGMRFHLHIYAVGDPQIKRHLYFCEYLKAHPADAENYAALKKTLAKQFTYDIYQYVLGKDKLVQSIDAKAKQWSGRRTDLPVPNLEMPGNKWAAEKIRKAVAVNLNVLLTHFSQYVNYIELVRIPGYTLINSGLANVALNYAIDADFNDADAATNIAAVTTYFREKQLPFTWLVSPDDKPEALGRYLEEANFKHTGNKIAAYLNLDTWQNEAKPLAKLQIRRAIDKDSLRDFAKLISHANPLFEKYYAWLAESITSDDPVEFYMGYIDQKPIAVEISCAAAGVMGLYCLRVADEEENYYSTAMHQFHLHRAKELGYHISTLLISPEEFPSYQRLGYKECGVFRVYKID